MVQTSSFLLLLAFSAVMMQAAPLERRNGHSGKDNIKSSDARKMLQCDPSTDPDCHISADGTPGGGEVGFHFQQNLPPPAGCSNGAPLQGTNPDGTPQQGTNPGGIPQQSTNPVRIPQQGTNPGGIPQQGTNPNDTPQQGTNPGGNPQQGVF